MSIKQSALIIIIVGLAIRLVYALSLGPVGGGDTAVYGLMSKHILELKEFFIYVPLAHYSGAAASYLGAIFFKIFGISPTALNMTAVLFSFLWMVIMYFIARELLDLTGVITALILVALPFQKFLVNYSLVVGMRSDEYFIISLVLLIFIKWVKSGYESPCAVPACLGFCIGIALWTSPNTVPLVLAMTTAVIAYGRKGIFTKVMFASAGFAAGYAPAIIYNLQYPGATFFRMSGRILDLDRSILTAPGLPGIIAERVAWKISLIPAAIARVPYLLTTMIGIPSTALFAGSVLLVLKDRGLRRHALKDAWGVLCLYVLWSFLFYVVLIQEDRDRYMATLCMLSPLFIGYLFSRINLRSRFLAITLLSALLVYNCYTIVYSFPAKGTDRYSALAERLVSIGARYGFSDYDTAYIAQLATKEKSVISPTLFHPTFSDRWPADTKLVRNAPEAFYVIDTYRYPEAAWLMEATCKSRGIRYKKEDVRGFEIYHGFSSKLYPEDLPFYRRP